MYRLYKHLENLYDTVNQYFPNDSCVLFQIHAKVKEQFKMEAKGTNFNENILKVH